MKILILHQHYKTPEQGGALRSYYLATALAERGFQPVVITAHNNQAYLVQLAGGIEVHYLPIAYDNSFGFFRRSLSFLLFAWKSIRLASTLKQVDYCYAISVPLTIGLPALWLRGKRKIPYIFEVGDLWPDAPIQMGYVRSIIFQRLLYRLEKEIYRRADLVVALSDAIAQNIRMKAPTARVEVISNMSDCDYFHPGPKDEEEIIRRKAHNQWVVSYAGAIGVANGLDYLLRCAKASKDASLPVHFFIAGKGALRSSLEAEARAAGLDNVTFLEFSGREGVRKLLGITDAVFVCYNRFPILETGSPHKYFDGLAAGKMILINFGGWMKEEILRTGCGIALDPDNAQDFVSKTSPIIASHERLVQFQECARQLAVSKYDRKKLSAQFAGLFSKPIS